MLSWVERGRQKQYTIPCQANSQVNPGVSLVLGSLFLTKLVILMAVILEILASLMIVIRTVLLVSSFRMDHALPMFQLLEPRVKVQMQAAPLLQILTP